MIIIKIIIIIIITGTLNIINIIASVVSGGAGAAADIFIKKILIHIILVDVIIHIEGVSWRKKNFRGPKSLESYNAKERKHLDSLI